MGQVALGFRSLFFRALVFFIMAALLAWALGGTLWPTPVCRTLTPVKLGSEQWAWNVCLDPSPSPPGRSPLEYFLVRHDEAGKLIEFDGLKGQYIVDILPLLRSSDQLVAVACAQEGTGSIWYMLKIDGNGTVVQQTKMSDRLSAVKAWSDLDKP